MSSIFTRIINGEIPSYKIAENDKFYAFLDVFPLPGPHCGSTGVEILICHMTLLAEMLAAAHAKLSRFV
jgi:hypothetical protein